MDPQRLVLYLSFAAGVCALYLSIAAFAHSRLNRDGPPFMPVAFFASGIGVATALGVIGKLVDGAAWALRLEPLVIAVSVFLLSEAPRRMLVPSLRLGFYLPLAVLAGVAASLPLPAAALASRVLFSVIAVATAWALLRPAARDGGRA